MNEVLLREAEEESHALRKGLLGYCAHADCQVGGARIVSDGGWPIVIRHGQRYFMILSLAGHDFFADDLMNDLALDHVLPVGDSGGAAIVTELAS